MPKNAVFRTSISWLRLLFCLSALALSASASNRIRIVLRYVPGETLRYRIESRTTTSGKITTPILNPEGATQSSLSVHLLVRLEVLDLPAGATPGAIRFRATYEESHAESQSDAFDPGQPSPSAPYDRLQGRSLEFTVEPGGNIADLKGLEDLFPDPAGARATLSWFDALSQSSRFPSAGIEIGERWKSEQRIDGAPVSDLIWRAESRYVRDEPCPLDTETTKPTSAAENCVEILTHYTISRRGSPHSDATPDDYLHNGLRVSGGWTGSGERLDSISVSRGVLIRSTQSSDQQMDYQITRAATGANVRNQSHVQVQSETSLVSAPSAP